MDKKAVFFDIDGTLFDRKIGIPESTKQAIKELKQRGNLAFISTGRTRAIIPDEIVDLGFDGVLAACGSYVEYKGKVIYSSDVDQDIVQYAIKVLKEHKVSFALEGRNYIYINEDNIVDRNNEMIRDIKMNFPDKVKLIDTNPVINKISCKINSNSDFDGACKMLENYFYCISHGSEGSELVMHGFSKATGIKIMLDHLNIDIKNTYAFGDSLNDLDMLKFVRYGIAMGNSNPKILEIAKYKTDCLENDGIYKGLKQFQLV